MYNIKIDRLKFIDSITSIKEDSFAKTFVSKCDLINAWDKCIGCFDQNNQLMGAIVTTISKNKVANLQLLHTFYKFRGKGVGLTLCNNSLQYAILNGAQYFRVSADKPAHTFYEKIGFKYIGEQKSGSRLSMFRLTSSVIIENDFTPDDFIWKQANKKGKGSCVKFFMNYEPRNLFN